MQTIGFVTSQKSTTNQLIIPDDFTHAMVTGETGSGKTTSMIYPNLEDRIKKNYGIFFIDFKGKEHEAVKALAKKHKRLKDVCEINVPWGVKINFLDELSDPMITSFIKDTIGHSKEEFWDNFATAIAKDLIASLKIITKFEDKVSVILNYKKFEDLSLEEHLLEPQKSQIRFVSEKQNTNKHYEKIKPTANLKNFLKISQNTEDFSRYVRVMMEYDKNLTEECLKDYVKNSNLSEDEINSICKIFTSLKRILGESINNLCKYANVSDNSLDTSNRLFVNYPNIIQALNLLGANDFLNHKEENLVNLLENNKIIIFNSSNIESPAMRAILNSILDNLRLRTIKKAKNSISIFIDEAQKSIDHKTNLQVDVLREAKVEVFLAFQNNELMRKSMGDLEFEALYGNLTHKYAFKNKDNNLEKFECIYGDEEVTLEPIFFDKKDLNNANLEFQKINQEKFEPFLTNVPKGCYLKYDPIIYSNSQELITVNSKNNQEHLIELVSEEALELFSMMTN